VVGTTTAVTSGNWSLEQPEDLPDGTHRVSARATDEAGNTSADSDANTFMVDVTPPSPPEVTSPANGSTTNGLPTYSGRAEPGSIVAVFVDGLLVSVAIANAVGEWRVVQLMELTNGSHTVKARATDSAGNTGADSNTDAFMADTVSPNPPVIASPVNVTTVNDNRPVYSGTAEAGSIVEVFMGENEVGTAAANDEGVWSVVQKNALHEGVYQVTATATDAVGNKSLPSGANNFRVEVIRMSHYGWGCTTTPAFPAIWALLAMALALGRRHRAR
jgi:hypothetical protein